MRPPSRFITNLVQVALLLSVTALQGAEVKDVRKKMGSRFEVTVVHESEARATAALEAAYAEIDRIEALISSWRDDSETTLINRNAGVTPVSVSDELFQLIKRAQKVSRLTNGAFDITFAGAYHVWDFRADPPILPDPAAVEAALAHVGYRRLLLDEARRTVYLEDPEAKIGFGAIGKGYAANRAAALLKREGATGGVINAGGDLYVFGRRENGAQWSVAITDPRDRDHVFAWLPLDEGAIVTSGDYEKFFIHNGKRYSHIIDPTTGRPVDHLRSVTIICPDAELADALATSVFILGPEKGLDLVNRLKSVEALLIDADGKHLYSSHIQASLQKEGP